MANPKNTADLAELKEKLAGAMKGSMAKAAALFNAPATKAVRTVAALQDKKEAEA